MNQQEIERKFLVKGDGWRGRGEGVLFRQGYIARTQDRTVRIRVAGPKGTLTIKYRGEGLARSEFEYDIPLDEAQALLTGWLRVRSSKRRASPLKKRGACGKWMSSWGPMPGSSWLR